LAHVVRGALVSLFGATLIAALAFDVRWTGPEQSAGAMIWGLAPLCAATILLDAHRRAAGWAPVGFGAAAGLAIVLWMAVLG
jgi:hypothetical protein